MKSEFAWARLPWEPWHAWPIGGKESLCGALSKGTVRVFQDVLEASQSLPAQDVCAPCQNQLQWLGLISRHLLAVRAKLAEDGRRALAARLAEIGSPEDVAAREVWVEMQQFLLAPWRCSRHNGNGRSYTTTTLPCVDMALAIVAPGTQGLLRLAGALRTFRTVTGVTSYGRYHADQVVQAVLEIPDIEAYVRHLKGRGLDSLAAVFHPNTLARARREPALRGVFAGTGAYWEATKDQLNIVEE
jgi:hypothetical protein